MNRKRILRHKLRAPTEEDETDEEPEGAEARREMTLLEMDHTTFSFLTERPMREGELHRNWFEPVSIVFLHDSENPSVEIATTVFAYWDEP